MRYVKLKGCVIVFRLHGDEATGFYVFLNSGRKFYPDHRVMTECDAKGNEIGESDA